MKAKILVAIVLAAALAGCGTEQEEGKLRVFATIPPLEYLVDRVGGAHVETGVLVAPGQSPHTFEPTPRQVADLSASELYFSIGLPFEEAVLDRVKSLSPNLRLVDMRRGITLRAMTAEEAGEEAHDAHDHAGEPDPHYWLNPRNARVMAAAIAQALEKADPDNAAEYTANAAALDADLAALDARLKAALAPIEGREILVFHPAFGYFADAYGLKQVAVEVSGREPSARQLAAIVERARRTGARVIFVQPQFSAKGAEAVAGSIDGVVVPMDDLAYDYVKNMDDMGRKIGEAVKDSLRDPAA
jgi:zinc transport system substrate-binding protein